VPYEQRRLQEFFERFDVRADGRRRDVERVRGAGETEVGGHCFKRAERIQRQFRGLTHRSVFFEPKDIKSRIGGKSISIDLTMQAKILA
jgi:hypothetical protein